VPEVETAHRVILSLRNKLSGKDAGDGEDEGGV